MNSLDLLSIGDVTYDTFMTPSESDAFCTLRPKESFICFTYGDKIPVKNLETSIGGNAANNAVGTTRMGIKSGLVTTMGDDDISQTIKAKLKREGVSLDSVITQKESSANFSTIVNYGGERTIFTYRPQRTYVFPENLPATDWAYLTSMAENFQDYYAKTVEWVKQNSVKLAFNPGSRQVRAGTDALRPVLEVTEVIYINRDEAESLTGLSGTENKEKELLQALCGLGPKKSIITDGANGSFVYDGSRFLKAGVLPVDAYERTGAGDAFGSGCVAALIKGKPFEEALLWGTLNSASVIGYVGSQKGLLAESDLPKWLERAQSCELKVVEF